jgi:hypothetical protein
MPSLYIFTEVALRLCSGLAESTEGLHRRRLKNALQVRAESVLDTNPPQADRVSAVSFSALPLGWVLPAGGEVIVQA